MCIRDSPYTGKLTGGKMIAKGKEYAGGQHGFARDVEHTLVGKTETSLTDVYKRQALQFPLALVPCFGGTKGFGGGGFLVRVQ